MAAKATSGFHERRKWILTCDASEFYPFPHCNFHGSCAEATVGSLRTIHRRVALTDFASERALFSNAQLRMELARPVLGRPIGGFCSGRSFRNLPEMVL